MFSEGRLQNPTICWDIRESRATHRAVRPDVYDSDNVTGADNQQERLGNTEAANWFLAGFIEGEGSLCVSIKRHPTCRHGYYVDPGFFLYRRESGRSILELAKATFGSGRISPKSGSPHVLTYDLVDQSPSRACDPVLRAVCRPFSCKRVTFTRFREILEMMQRKEHLRDDGLAETVRKVYSMNPESKGRLGFGRLTK